MIAASPFPWPVILITALIGLSAITWLLNRDHALAPRRILRALTTLRFALLGLLLLVLINPYIVRRGLDDRAYTVAILADASSSMLVPDIEGTTRLDFVASQIRHDAVANLRGRLAEQYPVEAHGFTDRLYPADPALELQTGRAAIGDALESLQARYASRSTHLGAVVLLSDGVERGSLSPTRVAQRYRDLGIPIHVVGIGETGEAGDVSIKFVHREHRGTREVPIPLDVTIDNAFQGERHLDVQIWEEDEMVDHREIRIGANESRRETFRVTPKRSGFRSYRATIASSANLGNPATDSDYASVLVEEPTLHRILFMGTPNWEYRFLRILIENEERYQLRSWLQIAPDRVIQRGFADDTTDVAWETFPETPESFHDFDVVILDSRVLNDLSSTLRTGLREFISVGGGGLVVWGPLPSGENEIAEMLPGRGLRTLRNPQDTILTPQPGPLLREEDHAIYTRNPAIFLSAHESAFAPERLTRGARSAIETREQDALFSYQAYGAGRVAYHGANTFWRWRMESSTGGEQHRRFWLSVFSWLSEARKPRLNSPIQATVQSLDQAIPLSVDLLDSAFRPRADVRVRARVTGPNATTYERTLFPRFGEPGRYESEVDLVHPGDYRATFEAVFPNGETLEREVFFSATASGGFLDTTMQEGLLRDIARLSGGSYYSWQDIEQLRTVELSNTIPVVEQTIYWARSFAFGLLVVGIALAEWFLRRRYGLR